METIDLSKTCRVCKEKLDQPRYDFEEKEDRWTTGIYCSNCGAFQYSFNTYKSVNSIK